MVPGARRLPLPRAMLRRAASRLASSLVARSAPNPAGGAAPRALSAEAARAPAPAPAADDKPSSSGRGAHAAPAAPGALQGGGVGRGGWRVAWGKWRRVAHGGRRAAQEGRGRGGRLQPNCSALPSSRRVWARLRDRRRAGAARMAPRRRVRRRRVVRHSARHAGTLGEGGGRLWKKVCVAVCVCCHVPGGLLQAALAVWRGSHGGFDAEPDANDRAGRCRGRF